MCTQLNVDLRSWREDDGGRSRRLGHPCSSQVVVSSPGEVTEADPGEVTSACIHKDPGDSPASARLFVSYGCCNKSSQIRWLRTLGMDSLMILQAETLKSRG